MASIYDIKPAFQRLLRPCVRRLAKAGITPNQVTIFTACLSIICGFFVALLTNHRRIFWVIPIIFLIRMALNAIDGLLAREHQMQTKLGGLLNEITDALSDAALYIPFALLTTTSPYWIMVIIILALCTEITGLAAIAIGDQRRYEGPMGKSDRAFVFSIIAIVLTFGITTRIWLSLIWLILIFLLCATIINRIQQALASAHE